MEYLDIFDLDRLKWVDPKSKGRFKKRELRNHDWDSEVSSEIILENILLLIDQIFDHLSVFEQYSETTSRGAKADKHKLLKNINAKHALIDAYKNLWNSYSILIGERSTFIEDQIKSLKINKATKGLKIHIGSGGHNLNGWLNIDAGGEDFALNINWGLPFEDQSSRYVYCAHVLEHIRFKDQAPVFVREIYRILENNGVVRFVVPDIRKLMKAYVENDQEFFKVRNEYYPLSEGFLNNGVATLDYILLFCGAGSQLLNYNHKFGYDAVTLCNLLLSSGFSKTKVCEFQSSNFEELRVDDYGYNARAKNDENEHFSLFVEAIK